MIELMKYTYMMEPQKVQEELDKLWSRYKSIINKENPSWEEVNEARAILVLTVQPYCEKIAPEAIKRRLHLLKEKLTLIEFLSLIDKNSEKLTELRKDELFNKLEQFYRIVRNYKHKGFMEGLDFHEEKQFIKKHEEANPNKGLKLGSKGTF